MSRVCKWRKEQVLAVQDEIRLATKAFADPTEKVRWLSARIAEEPHDTSRGRMVVYVCCVAILIHQRQGQLLKPGEINQLYELAESMLRAEGVSEQSRTLAFLYGDLHWVMSQIHWSVGDSWKSAWEQLLATSYGYEGDVRPGSLTLGYGIRQLRLGNTDLAEDAFRRAIALLPQDHPDSVRARVLIVRASRLSGRLDQAKSLAAECLENASNQDAQVDVSWEQKCIAAQRGDTRPIANAIDREGTHYTPCYFLEGFFWLYAAGADKHFRALPKITYLAHKKRLDLNSEGKFYEAARLFEGCLDTESPEKMRLAKICKVTSLAPELGGVEQEILLLAATCRLLNELKATDFLVLVEREYRQLSLRLTAQATDDLLGTLAQLRAVA